MIDYGMRDREGALALCVLPVNHSRFVPASHIVATLQFPLRNLALAVVWRKPQLTFETSQRAKERR